MILLSCLMTNVMLVFLPYVCSVICKTTKMLVMLFIVEVVLFIDAYGTTKIYLLCCILMSCSGWCSSYFF